MYPQFSQGRSVRIDQSNEAVQLFRGFQHRGGLWARGGDADMSRFLQIAMGSASELEYQLLLSRDLGFVRESDHRALASQATEVKRMLASLLHKLRADS